jgi:hypothetical protein
MIPGQYINVSSYSFYECYFLNFNIIVNLKFQQFLSRVNNVIQTPKVINRFRGSINAY